MSSQSKPSPEPRPLIEILQSCKVEYTEHDLFLFGDGSGLSWEIGGGFATFLVDRNKQLRKHLIGARTLTTVNRMELSAYTEALSYHYECVMSRRIKEPPYNVVVITDSELTARIGNGVYSRKANGDLWQAVDWFVTRGYRIQWVWVPRNSTPYHELADYLAGAARRGVIALRLEDSELYRVAPWHPGEDDQDGPDELAVCSACGTPAAPGDTTCAICGAGIETGGNLGVEETEE